MGIRGISSIVAVGFVLILQVSPVMAMGRRIKPEDQAPSLEANQPEVELIRPEELPPAHPITEELKEKKPQDISANLAPDEATKNRQIQTALKNAGYDPGVIDGKMGTKTKKAVKDFQTANGLTVDGRVGPKTWTKLSAYLLQTEEEKGDQSK